MNVKLLARENTTLRTESVKWLARASIKLHISAFMEREKITVPPVSAVHPPE